MDGLVCGRYRTTKKLGAGGMAEVWLAKHEMIDQQAAIKLLQPQMSQNQEIVRRFLKEAQAAAAIKHPGIVEIYDVGRTSDGRAYIVMELLRGEPLGDRLSREGQLSIEQTTRLMRQLAGVMDAAHQARIFHRDLKPDNLYIVPDPEVQGGERIKVLDFGLAKLAAEFAGSIVTSRGAVFGTPAYMAPEQCKDSGRVDGRADLYSIGCIFYRCLCGQPPFDYKEPLLLLQAQLTQTPRAPRLRRADIPAELDELIMRLLAKHPGDRVQTCAELITALGGDASGGATLIDEDESVMTLIDGDEPQGAHEPSTVPGARAPVVGDDAVTLVNLGHDSVPDGVPVPVAVSSVQHAETERVAVPPALLHGAVATGQPTPQLFPRPGTAPAPMAHGSAQLAPGRPGTEHPPPVFEQPSHRAGHAWLIAGAVVLAVVLVTAGLYVHLKGGETDAAESAPEQTTGHGPEDGSGPVLVPATLDAGSAPLDAGPADASPVMDAVLPDAAPPDAEPEPVKTVQRSGLDKAEIDALLATSRNAATSGDYQTAYDACRKIIASQARHAEANRYCAMSACKLGKDVRVVKRYSRYLADDVRAMVARFCKLNDL